MADHKILNAASNDSEESTRIPKYIPEDIILQILPRIPVKSILRLRSVCKLWKSAIDDPSFVDIHLAHANSRFLFIFSFEKRYGSTRLYSANLQGGPAVPLLNLPALNGYTEQDVAKANFCVLESLNGLMFLTTRTYCGDYYYICNPSTRKITMLPPAEACPFKDCHSVKWYCNYSFGYDHINNKYKVLHLYEVGPHIRTRPYWSRKGFEVYTLGGTGWRYGHIDETTFDGVKYNIVGKSGCVHGAIHWIMRCSRERVLSLLAFDLQSEEFRFSPLPQALSEDYFRLQPLSYEGEKFEGVTRFKTPPEFHLSQAGGRMVILYRDTDDLMNIKLWVLEDCESKLWINKNIQLPCLPTLSMIHPNCSTKSVEILLDPCTFPLDSSFNPLYLKEKADGYVRVSDLPEWIFEREPEQYTGLYSYYFGSPADHVCERTYWTYFVESFVPLEGAESELVHLPPEEEEEEVESDDG